MTSLSRKKLEEVPGFAGCTKWCSRTSSAILEAILEFGKPPFQEKLRISGEEIRRKNFLTKNGCRKTLPGRLAKDLHDADREWEDLPLHEKLAHLWHTVTFEDYARQEAPFCSCCDDNLIDDWIDPLSLEELSLGHACKIFSPNCDLSRNLTIEPLCVPRESNEADDVKKVRGLLAGSLICVSLMHWNAVIKFLKNKKYYQVTKN